MNFDAKFWHADEMDTARVDTSYRPLRFAWVVMPGDIAAFRKITQLTCTLAGGRFNPVVFANDADAKSIIENFGVDFLLPVGDAPELKAFTDQYPHLAVPFFGGPSLHFKSGARGHGTAHVLTIENLLAHGHREPEWQSAVKVGVRRFVWDDADPLADVFLIEHGRFPSADDVFQDYGLLVANAAAPEKISDIKIDPAAPIPAHAATQPGFAYLGRFGLRPHKIRRPSGWSFPGIYVGDAGSLEDLVTFWNIRAANVQLRFVDRAHMGRYATTLPLMLQDQRQRIAHLDEFHRQVAVWSRQELDAEAIKGVVGDEPVTFCRVGDGLWNGLNLVPPMMVLGDESALGVVLDKYDSAVVSFGLSKKPFNGDNWFYMQNLVASVSMFRARSEDGTFIPPYIPELNEKFGRATNVGHDALRVEYESVGIVIDATRTDLSIKSISTMDLVEAVFEERGLKASLSNAGLITRQLMTQMGGVDGTRAFKIPGVRRLIRSSGLNESVTKNKAHALIGGHDPANPTANFDHYKRLFIEQRPIRDDLTPPAVFAHLVAKGVFRIGADVQCPKCRLNSWFTVDDLKLNVACTYCGAAVDTTRQLTGGELTYRRSGLLGIERNLQGAIPVTMVLQQLWMNGFSSLGDGAVFLPSLDLEAKDGTWPTTREIDFFAMELNPDTESGKTRVVFGEAKDRGSDFDANDVETMKLVAERFKAGRFEPYILFAKLNAFSDAEIALAADLAQTHKVILLSDQELEPLHVYDRASEAVRNFHFHDLDGMVEATALLYPPLKRPLPRFAAAGADEPQAAPGPQVDDQGDGGAEEG